MKFALALLVILYSSDLRAQVKLVSSPSFTIELLTEDGSRPPLDRSVISVTSEDIDIVTTNKSRRNFSVLEDAESKYEYLIQFSVSQSNEYDSIEYTVRAPYFWGYSNSLYMPLIQKVNSTSDGETANYVRQLQLADTSNLNTDGRTTFISYAKSRAIFKARKNQLQLNNIYDVYAAYYVLRTARDLFTSHFIEYDLITQTAYNYLNKQVSKDVRLMYGAGERGMNIGKLIEDSTKLLGSFDRTALSRVIFIQQNLSSHLLTIKDSKQDFTKLRLSMPNICQKVDTLLGYLDKEDKWDNLSGGKDTISVVVRQLNMSKQLCAY